MTVGYFFIGMIAQDIWPWFLTKVGKQEELSFGLSCPEVSTNSEALRSELDEDALRSLGSSLATVEGVQRRGRNIFVEMKLHHPLEEGRAQFSVSVKSPSVNSGNRSIAGPESFVYDIHVFPGQSKAITVGDTLPKEFDAEILYAEVTVQMDDAVRVWSEFEISLGESATALARPGV